ncbi:MAG: CdaR family protein [Chrysiogenales bacterium]
MKTSALLLAVLVWAIISGQEKTYSEKTLKIPIEIINVSPNLEVVNLQPEEARISLKGSANLILKIRPESLAIKIDLKNITESSKLNYFAEDYLEIPQGIQIISLHPKMIEVYVEEFDAKEVPVKIRFHGQLKEPLKLKEAKVIPDRVTIIGYKSQLGNITVVLTEEVNLDEIEASQKRKVALKQTRNILKFRDHRDVELVLEIESLAAKKK